MKAQLQAVVNHVHRVGSLNESQARSDRELLSQFASRRDTQAFTAIVERHGSLVLGVCRRLLSHQDAEDAFQATFLVLAQKPDTVRKGESLSNWLHGVSYRIALKISRSYARRKKREQRPR